MIIAAVSIMIIAAVSIMIIAAVSIDPDKCYNRYVHCRSEHCNDCRGLVDLGVGGGSNWGWVVGVVTIVGVQPFGRWCNKF